MRERERENIQLAFSTTSACSKTQLLLYNNLYDLDMNLYNM